MTEHPPKQHGRRSPTPNELAAWRSYVETAEAIRRALEAEFLAESGISATDYAVMLTLSEADGRELRSSALAAEIGWERSRLSHHLRRMEERALVRRRQVGPDARSAAVTLTNEGAALFRRASASHLRLVREMFVDAFDRDELETVRTVSNTLRQHLDTRIGIAVPTDI